MRRGPPPWPGPSVPALKPGATYLLLVCLSRPGEVACLGEQVPQLLTDGHGALRVTALGFLQLLLQPDHR